MIAKFGKFDPIGGLHCNVGGPITVTNSAYCWPLGDSKEIFFNPLDSEAHFA